LGSFGLETHIPGCCSRALASQVVPDLGAPRRKAPTLGAEAGIRDTAMALLATI